MWKYNDMLSSALTLPAAVGRLPRLRKAFVPIFTVCCLLLVTGCRQDMQDQPKAKPYRASTFFRDGTSARPLVEGTVPRGYLQADKQLFTGKKTASADAGQGVTAGQAVVAYPDARETVPFPITEQILDRGQERFQIFCSVCHGMTGEGDGIVVRRGFRQPPSFHEPRLREAPVGHFFDVITNGWGAMPAHAAQIPVQDRWAIIAYLRALQLSQPVAPSQPVQGPVPAPSGAPSAGGQQDQ